MMTRTMILAGMALLASASPAEASSITIGPIRGGGLVTVFWTQQTTGFSSTGGRLTIDYEAPTPETYPYPTGYLTMDTGSAGYVVTAAQDFYVWIGDGTTSFSAYDGLQGGVWALFYGNFTGDFSSLQFFEAGIFPDKNGGTSGIEVTFNGERAPVPEPSGMLLLAAGLAGVGLLGWRRRARPA